MDCNDVFALKYLIECYYRVCNKLQENFRNEACMTKTLSSTFSTLFFFLKQNFSSSFMETILNESKYQIINQTILLLSSESLFSTTG